MKIRRPGQEFINSKQLTLMEIINQSVLSPSNVAFPEWFIRAFQGGIYFEFPNGLTYPQAVAICEFAYRIPYWTAIANQGGGIISRIAAIFAKFKTNLLNYQVKLNQLNQLQQMLNTSNTQVLSEQYSQSQSVQQSQEENTKSQANSVDGKTFNPIGLNANGQFNASQPTAESAGKVETWSDIANADMSNNNVDTARTQTQSTNEKQQYTRTHNNQLLEQYYGLKIEADNVLRPVLKAMDTLFLKIYSTEQNEEGSQWS